MKLFLCLVVTLITLAVAFRPVIVRNRQTALAMAKKLSFREDSRKKLVIENSIINNSII